MRAPRILSILARAGLTQYATAEEDLAQLFARQLPDASRDVIVVDNLLPADVREISPHRVLIGGDNACWEFSAFDAAVRHAGARLFEYDWVHLATSAFGQLYTSYLDRFTPAVLAAAAGRAACVCHLDCYNREIVVEGVASQHWARTAFLLLPPAAVAALGSFVSVREPARFFSGDPRDPFRADAPLSAQYRDYIIQWLTGQDTGQGGAWHSPMTLTAAMLPRFEAKALAILNEHSLSIRLRRQCALIDVTWLSAELRRRAPNGGPAIDWRTPWRAQLAGRDRDALHPA